MQNNVDCETLLKSLVFMADGVAATIGDMGARATMRLAGHRAAVSLLEALPLELDREEAIRRAGPIMVELGFVADVTFVDERHLAVDGGVMFHLLRRLKRETQRHPACYYPIGLFEGFVNVLSKQHVSVVQHQVDGEREIWTLER
ncbi:MAG: hypothetical protein M1482_04805 [Chloroflexi bacterium]|nr:hypothetical protein [Chloroflexota bacterium]